MIQPISLPRPLARRVAASVLVLSLLGGLATAGGCGGSVQTYPLSVPGAEGARYFASLQTCAAEAKLNARQGMHGVYVTLDGGTELQFLVQGASFNLVVWVNSSVPEPEFPRAQQAGKAKADEIFACAQKLGPSEAPPAPTGGTAEPTQPGETPTSTPAPTTTATAAPTAKPSATVEAAHMQIKTLAPEACAPSKKKCEKQGDCDLTERCAQGACYAPKNGCPCVDDSGCDVTTSHCGQGICYPNAAGAPCDNDGNAMECGLASGFHCAKGLCYPNKTGAPCKEDWECTVGPTATGSSACVQGVCN